MSTYLRPNDKTGSTFNPSDYIFNEGGLTSNQADVRYGTLAAQNSLIVKTAQINYDTTKTHISGTVDLGDHNVLVTPGGIGVFNDSPTRELDVVGSINASSDILINNSSIKSQLDEIKQDIEDNTNSILDNAAKLEPISYGPQPPYGANYGLNIADKVNIINDVLTFKQAIDSSILALIYYDLGRESLNIQSLNHRYIFSNGSNYATLYIGQKNGTETDLGLYNRVETRGINDGTNTELLLFEGQSTDDKIRLKSGSIQFDIKETTGDDSYDETPRLTIESDKTTIQNDCYVKSDLYIGDPGSEARILLGGGAQGDSGYNHAVIQSRNYEDGENTETVIFHGNDHADRVRLRSGKIVLDCYDTATTNIENENKIVEIDPDKVTINKPLQIIENDLNFLRSDLSTAGFVRYQSEGLILGEDRGGDNTYLQIGEEEITMKTNDTERLRISKDGEVQISGTLTCNDLRINKDYKKTRFWKLSSGVFPFSNGGNGGYIRFSIPTSEWELIPDHAIIKITIHGTFTSKGSSNDAYYFVLNAWSPLPFLSDPPTRYLKRFSFNQSDSVFETRHNTADYARTLPNFPFIYIDTKQNLVDWVKTEWGTILFGDFHFYFSIRRNSEFGDPHSADDNILYEDLDIIIEIDDSQLENASQTDNLYQQAF